MDEESTDRAMIFTKGSQNIEKCIHREVKKIQLTSFLSKVARPSGGKGDEMKKERC